MKLIHLFCAFTGFALITGTALALAEAKQDGRLAALMAEFMHYQVAVSSFEDKTGELPGDMPNATEIWGIAGGNSGTDIDCYTVDSSRTENKQATCDGNGNGEIFHQDNVRDETAPEWFRAWQHLANAGLIDTPEAGFSGRYDAYPRGATAGVNVPESKIFKGVGYTLMHYERFDHPMWFPGDYFGFALGKSQSTNLNLLPLETRGPALPNAIAAAFDAKMDDGLPRTGRVRSWRDLPTCIYRSEEESEHKGDYVYRRDYPHAGCALFLGLRDLGGEDVTPYR